MQLLSNETIKYEVTHRNGNTIVRKEFATKSAAMEYANSWSLQHSADWVTLTTIEKIK